MNYKKAVKMIAKEWKDTHWMKINGFLFFMSECYQKSTDTVLIIYDKGTDIVITSIDIREIKSLIIDGEVIL